MKSLVLLFLAMMIAGFGGAAPTSKSSRESTDTASKEQTLAEIDPRHLKADYISRLVFDLINEQRRRNKLPVFRRSSKLSAPAQEHSEDMARRNYFSHGTKKLLKDPSFDSRIRKDGYSPSRTAENIAMQPVIYRQTTRSHTQNGRPVRTETINEIRTYEDMARLTVEGWMNSPGHRRNILDPELNAMGIGAAVGDRDGIPYVYFTQDFAREE